MSEVLNVLTRKTSLRKACKTLSLAEMEKLAENLSELIEEHKQEAEARIAEEKAKTEMVETIKQKMQAAGLDISDLMQAMDAAAPKKPKGTVKPKYQIQDGDGNIHQWTGRGRTPKVFQEYLDQGGSKDDCLIG